MRYILPLALLVLVGTLGACVSGAGSGSGGDRNVITQEQLAEHSDMTAMEVIRRLRPQWLRVRGGQSGMRGGVSGTDASGLPDVNGDGRGTPAVIEDGRRVSSDLGYLERISASQIQELRFLDSATASRRHGTGYTWGAIEIITRRN